MKRGSRERTQRRHFPFSALGRAVWDETLLQSVPPAGRFSLSVLSVEPYGMKHAPGAARRKIRFAFSALGRAVWDETSSTAICRWMPSSFSALGRAVWDETSTFRAMTFYGTSFQCSRSSRMG